MWTRLFRALRTLPSRRKNIEKIKSAAAVAAARAERETRLTLRRVGEREGGEGRNAAASGASLAPGLAPPRAEGIASVPHKRDLEGIRNRGSVPRRGPTQSQNRGRFYHTGEARRAVPYIEAAAPSNPAAVVACSPRAPHESRSENPMFGSPREREREHSRSLFMHFCINIVRPFNG